MATPADTRHTRRLERGQAFTLYLSPPPGVTLAADPADFSAYLSHLDDAMGRTPPTTTT